MLTVFFVYSILKRGKGMKTYKRVVSTVLALVLMLSVFAVGAGALSLKDLLNPSDNTGSSLPGLLGSVETLTTSKPVTVKFKKGDLLSCVLKFDATKSGYYYFYAYSKDVFFTVVELNEKDQLSSFLSSSYSTKQGTAVLTELKKGHSYYILTIPSFNGNQSAISDDFELKFKAKYYGKMTSLKITKQPTTVYVDGYNADVKSNYVELDSTGLEGVAKFKNGKTLKVYGDFFFEESDLYENDEPSAKIGKNVHYFKCCGFKLKLVYRIKKNPVKKIEIVSLPDKTEYVYGLGGQLSSLKLYNIGFVDLSGLKLKVTYTDGKTKTIGNFEPSLTDFYYSNAEYTSKDSEYPLYAYAQDSTVPGSTVVDLSYMEKRTSFKVDVRKPSTQEIALNLPSYFTLISDMFFYMFDSVSNYLPF